MSQREPADYLPVKPDVFTILMILVDGNAYGYGIIKEAAERTDGQMRLQAGALYRRLKWMLSEGLIAEFISEDDPLIHGQAVHHHQRHLPLERSF